MVLTAQQLKDYLERAAAQAESEAQGTKDDYFLGKKFAYNDVLKLLLAAGWFAE